MSESIANKLSRNPFLAENEINFLLTELQGFRDPSSIPADATFYVPFADEVRLRQESHTVRMHLTGTTPATEDRERECTRTGTTMIRKMSANPKSYPLIHTTVGGALEFPSHNGLNKFGGGGRFSGSNYITIDNHSRLNPTDEISIGGQMLLKHGAGIQEILVKDQQYKLELNSSDVLEASVYISGSWGTVASFDISALLDTFHDYWLTWKSPNLKLIVDGTTQGTATRTGTLNTTTNKLGIGARGDGTNKIVDDSIFAWISLLHKEVSASWLADHGNGILDTDGTNIEITTIPMVGDERPLPEGSFSLATSE